MVDEDYRAGRVTTSEIEARFGVERSMEVVPYWFKCAPVGP